MRYFLFPTLVSCVALLLVFLFGGWTALVTAVLLTVLEVTLSFDNAVVNARVLMRMTEVWRRRFLTWGILIAVVGTRLVLPIVIVSIAVWMSPLQIAVMAVLAPSEYAHLLESVRHMINAFGGAFLLMVALKYFFDERKEIHWIGVIEKHLTKWGRIEAIEIGIALLTLLVLSFIVPHDEQAGVLASGIIGIGLFILMEGVAGTFSAEVDGEEKTKHTGNAVSTVAHQGLALFLYLNILDSAFSLDGVVGAFALTTSIPIIVAGLGIGAYFVRVLTIYFVRKRTLETLRYLEHGAHWAIFGLAASMFASLLFHIPEIVTGTIGLAFVVGAYYSSLRLRLG